MPRQTVIITGGAGMLASDLTRYLTDHTSYDLTAPTRQEFDIMAERGFMQAAFEIYRPSVVINTAVFHVEPSETDPQTAFAINAWAVRNLAQMCQQYQTTLVQISSCGLFGDEVRAYHEYDNVTLKTVYAQSKYASEGYVRQFCERHFIIRLGWLYGGSPDHSRNFVMGRYREAQQKTVIQSAGDKFGSPTYTLDVAKTLVELLNTQQYGLYHLANEGCANRAAYVERIVRAFGLSTPVESVDSSYFPRRANVPNCEWLTSYNLNYIGLKPLPAWEESVDRYVQTLRSVAAL